MKMVHKFNVYGLFYTFFALCNALDGPQDARILSTDFNNDGGGPYQFSFETSDGVKRDETGELVPSIHDESQNTAFVKGSFSYTGPDGVLYEVKYTADESGFHPEGEHFKVPPFTPWMKGQPIDDGQYKHDSSGDYHPKNSATYEPENGEATDDVDLKKKKYSSGENIFDTYRPSTSPSNTVTTQYLPSLEPEASHVSGESILEADRSSQRPGTGYLPAARNNEYNQPPVSQDLLREAIYTTPTPHPQIVLHSNSPNNFEPPKNRAGPTAAELVQIYSQPRESFLRQARGFQYKDLNPELRGLIDSIH